MPESPNVTFNVINNNTASVETQLGIGFVIARTTKGKFFDPSLIINSLNQFKENFGEEIVPDGSLSNIQRALSLGSKVRVCRVGHLTESGNLDAVKGTLTTGKVSGNIYVPDTGDALNLVLTGYEENPITLKFRFKTKEYGGDISSINGKFMCVFSLVGNTVYSTLYNTNTVSNIKNAFQVYQNPLVSFKNGDVSNPLFFDTTEFKKFIQFDKYLETEFIQALHGSEVSTTIVTLEDVYQLLNKAQTVNATTLQINDSGAVPLTLSSIQRLTYLGTIGNSGTKPVADDWKIAIEYARDYNDYYDVFCSHVHQHLGDTAMAVHQAAALVVESMGNSIYDIEIPKTNVTAAQINAAKEAIGINSKYVAYFAGGLNLYNNQGTLQGCDVLGTVLGLSASAATQFGPWYSFAGQNRGIVGDAKGPVANNYGGIGNYAQLNTLSKNSINIFVIKETATGAKATMLWHNFTSSLSSDSERFLNVERLIIYIKKILRPVMERYLEEPNTFGTWDKMYLEIEPIMIDIENRQGVSEWEWIGDQYISSFNELQVNTESDVRQGKYKAILRIKDVVALQNITIDITIDAASRVLDIQTQ